MQHNPSYFADQTFKDLDHSEKNMTKAEYECCVFINCDFSTTKIFELRFRETEFIDCNFSNAKLSQTSFQDVFFQNCKMLGLKFDECNPFNFSAAFENCLLNYSSFYQMDLNRTNFKECKLVGADFTEADLNNIKINHCDLLDARFENTNLEKADFTDSINYSINPEINRVKEAIFSYPDVLGLLDSFEININQKP